MDRTTVGVVIPTGYSFNLDGTAIYLTMASIFIADALGKPLSHRRADLAAGVHDHRLQGRCRRHRRRPGHPRRWALLAPSGAARRRRPDRRHRPVHVRGAGADQLRRQRRRDRAGRPLDRHLQPRTSCDRVLAGEDPFDERTMLDDDHSEGDRARSIPVLLDDEPPRRSAASGRVEQVEAEPSDRRPLAASRCSSGVGSSSRCSNGSARQSGEDQQLQRVGAAYDVARGSSTPRRAGRRRSRRGSRPRRRRGRRCSDGRSARRRRGAGRGRSRSAGSQNP